MEKLNTLILWGIISQRQDFIIINIDKVILHYGPFQQFGSYYENIFDFKNQQVKNNKSLLLIYSLIFDNSNTLFNDNYRALNFIKNLDIDASLENKKNKILKYIDSIKYYNTL